MQLAWSKIGLTAVLLLCASCFAWSQSAGPATAAACKQSVNKADYEGHNDGPWVTDMGYSRPLASCVVVVHQGFPAEGHMILMYTEIFAVNQRKSLWSNKQLVHRGPHVNDRNSALLSALKKLNIELAPR